MIIRDVPDLNYQNPTIAGFGRKLLHLHFNHWFSAIRVK